MITKEEFEREYAHKSGVAVEWLHQRGEVAVPCDCKHETCIGWKMAHSPMMTILIPLGPGMEPHPKTLASIEEQTIPCEVLKHTSPMVETGERLRDKRSNEMVNRNALLPKASTPYAAYVDSDVVFSSPHDIEDCCKFLDAHPDIDAVALDTKGQDVRRQEKYNHVVVACMVIRTAVWAGYTWVAFWSQCGCIDANKKFRICYLDNRQLKEVGQQLL